MVERELREAIRPKGTESELVVLGCGTVHIRKGIDLFLMCAAAVTSLSPKRSVRFVWVGHGYNPEGDWEYSSYLADQIARSGLEGHVAVIDETTELKSAYALADVFLLTSRLDPMPNVAIDAALRGMPVICFDGTTGIADLLRGDAGNSFVRRALS